MAGGSGNKIGGSAESQMLQTPKWLLTLKTYENEWHLQSHVSSNDQSQLSYHAIHLLKIVPQNNTCFVIKKMITISSKQLESTLKIITIGIENASFGYYWIFEIWISEGPGLLAGGCLDFWNLCPGGECLRSPDIDKRMITISSNKTPEIHQK